jgi:hypothetical protein
LDAIRNGAKPCNTARNSGFQERPRLCSVEGDAHPRRLALIPPAVAQVPTIPPPAPITFEETGIVLHTDVPRFSVKLSDSDFKPWGSPPMFNSWVVWGNPEPIEQRHKLIASGGSADYIEAAMVAGRSGGLSQWDIFRTGWYDGATVEVVRYNDEGAQLVRRARVVRSVSGGPDSENRLYLDGPGPEVQAGDQFTIALRRTDVRRELLRPWTVNPPWQWFETQGTLGDPEIDDTQAAPEGGSTASLRFRLGEGTTTIRQPWLHNREGWVRLNDTDYEFRAWVRREGDGPATVTLKAGDFGEVAAEVDGTWQLVRVPFRGGPVNRSPTHLEIRATGPATLWVDNLGVFETSLPYFAPYPWVVEALRSMRLGYIRVWPLHTNVGPSSSLLGRLGDTWSASSLAEGRRVEGYNQPGLHALLELCAQVGAQPWITTSTQFTLEEQRQLIEYLAAPADTGFGAVRARLGRREPWTAAFPKILIELGNEVWNGNFTPQGFAGDPVRYGKFAQLVFDTMRTAPGYDDQRFGFVLNGWIADTTVERGYGQRAAVPATLGAYVGYAPYLGGWDIGVDLGAGGAQELLLYNVLLHRVGLATAAASVRSIAERRGAPLTNVLYESGPGYSLPNPQRPFIQEEELRGKSLASALAYVDQLMSNRLHGFGPQAFFAFRPGRLWSSHAIGLHPLITTHAIAVLNRYAVGDLLETTATGIPTIDLPQRSITGPPHGRSLQPRNRVLAAQQDVPLVVGQAYAEGRIRRYAVYSLRATGPTPVTIRLPTGLRGTIEATILTDADPMAHNIDADRVRPQPFQDVRIVDGTLQFVLPPASLIGIEVRP